jgi:hypothetical protein
MGPPAFSSAAVHALSMAPPSSTQFVSPKFVFISLDFLVCPQFHYFLSKIAPVTPEALDFEWMLNRW